MRHRTHHHLSTLLWVVLSLLFSQLALASYLCPAQVNLASMDQRMAAGKPCEGMDPVQPTLCHQHSAASAQSFEAPQVPEASWPAVIQVWVLPAVIDAAPSGVVAFAAVPERRPPPDPLFLSTLRLRV